MNTVWMVMGILLTSLTVMGTIELAMLTLGGILPARRARKRETRSQKPRMAVVIPAYNEQTGIARCIRSLNKCDRAKNWFSIVVIADNCTDRTAEVAREHGARVLMRNDPLRRGKGYALDFAFRTLLSEGYDEMIVIDADSEVDSNLIREFRSLFDEGADAIQCRYTVANPDVSTRTRLMNLALMAFNVLRPRGRDRFGISAGLLGNGFGITADTLAAVPYDAVSVVEDLEYHIRLVSSGRRVRFTDRASVKAEMPAGGRGASTQRARWEGGRFRMIASLAPALAARVLRGELRLIEPLLELLLLPLAFHVVILLATLVPPYGPTRIYATAGLAVVALHIISAIRIGGGGLRDLGTLCAAPFYIIWKIALLPKMLVATRKNAEWVRTERAGTEGGRI